MTEKYQVEVILTCRDCANQWSDIIFKEGDNPDVSDEIEDEGKIEDDTGRSLFDDFEEDNEYGGYDEDKDAPETEFFCPICGSSRYLIDEVV